MPSHPPNVRPHILSRLPSLLTTLLTHLLAFLGAFLSLLSIEAIFRASTLRAVGTPVVFASFGAAAILSYALPTSPASQPRPAFFGQLLSSIIGIGIAKLFALAPPPYLSSTSWLAGALSVAISSVLMSLTQTVYPPAGATALLVATDPTVVGLGWLALPLVLLGTVLILVAALLANNVQGRWPEYWWTPEESNDITVSASQVSVPGWLELRDEERDCLERLKERLVIRRNSSSKSGPLVAEIA